MTEHKTSGADETAAEPIPTSLIGQTPVRSTAYRWARDARKNGHSGVQVSRDETGYYSVRRLLTLRERGL